MVRLTQIAQRVALADLRKVKTLEPAAGKAISYGKGRGGRPWRRLRDQVFARDQYLCQVCKHHGRITEARICDHIIPLSQGGTDHITNLQALCQSCSDAKTLQESKGIPSEAPNTPPSQRDLVMA